MTSANDNVGPYGTVYCFYVFGHHWQELATGAKHETLDGFSIVLVARKVCAAPMYCHSFELTDLLLAGRRSPCLIGAIEADLRVFFFLESYNISRTTVCTKESEVKESCSSKF